MWRLVSRMRAWVNRRQVASRRSGTARRTRRFFRLEGLEPRWALARWYVNAFASGANTGDSWADAFTSLQEALMFTGFEGEEIWVARGTYRPTGDNDRQISFELHDRLLLYGGFAGFETELEQRDISANPTILSGDIGEPGDVSDNSYHVVKVPSEFVEGELNGFTITAGNANGNVGDDIIGGGLRNHGILRIVNCRIVGNTAQEGGGIHTSNGLQVLNSEISGNTALGPRGGGGIVTEGGVYGPGHLELTDTRIIGNSATSGGGVAARGKTNMVRVLLTENYATEDKGAGVFNTAVTEIADSEFRENIAGEDDGGGIYNTGNLNISRTTFLDNMAARKGGAISNAGSLDLRESNVEHNRARYGGGIHNFNFLVVGDTTLSRNIATELGGGLYHEFGSVTFTNGTISTNTAFGGAGVYSTGQTLLFDHATIALNVAASFLGAGIHTTTPDTWLLHTLVATNARASDEKGVPDDLFGDFHGDSSYNLIGAGDNATGIANGINNNSIGTAAMPIQPLLGPLANNGGMAKTHLLLPGSPAIDAGSPFFVPGSGFPPVNTDQRGMQRVVDGDGMGGPRIDIGSVEAPEGSASPLLGDLNNDGRVGLRDLIILRNNLGLSGPVTPQQGDLNSDSIIDLADMVILTEHYGSTFSAPSPAAVVQTSGVGDQGSAVRGQGVVRGQRRTSVNQAIVATRRISGSAVDRILSRQSTGSSPSATIRASRSRIVARASDFSDELSLGPRADRG